MCSQPNGTNMLEIMIFANAAKSQALLVARLDNLGKVGGCDAGSERQSR
jgi:N-acetyl-gamma-glutamylphosphate reductase